MRVIAGEFRGRTLIGPEGEQTRPITDRVKETLFNILGSKFGTPAQIPPVEVLDLFAGAGNLGIEAVSRGASKCVFVEKDRRTIPALRTNLAKCRADERLKLTVDNAFAMRLPLADDPAGFGLIFVDPPYRDAERGPRVIDLLERVGTRLAADGLIVFRFEAGTAIDFGGVRSLRVCDDRTYGRMRLVFLAKPGSAAGGAADAAVATEQPDEEHGAADAGEDADGEFVVGDDAGEGVAER